MVVHRKHLRATLIRLIDLLRRPGPGAEIVRVPFGEALERSGRPMPSVITGGAYDQGGHR